MWLSLDICEVELAGGANGSDVECAEGPRKAPRFMAWTSRKMDSTFPEVRRLKNNKHEEKVSSSVSNACQMWRVGDDITKTAR